MQKWDYLFIVVDHESGNDPGRPRYVNGQELPSWGQGENIFGVMNRLGWHGWECYPPMPSRRVDSTHFRQKTYQIMYR